VIDVGYNRKVIEEWVDGFEAVFESISQYNIFPVYWEKLKR